MSAQRSYIFAAGGSGGHVIPGLAISEALLELDPDCKITFVGIGREIEKKLVLAEERGGRLNYETIEFKPVVGKKLMGLVNFCFRLPNAILEARSLFKRTSTSVVIGFGGFPSFVPVFSAWLMNLPAVLHEQNVKSGLANKVLCRFTIKNFAPPGSDLSAPKERLEYLANPVRKQFNQVSSWTKHDRPLTVLVLGGSQGARNVNNAVLALAPFWDENKIKLIHQSGARELDRVRAAYLEKGFKPEKLEAFFSNLDQLLAKADIVISRAGAMATAEIAAAGRAAIFIPLSISRGHQGENVARLCQEQAALMLKDGENLANNLESLLKDLEKDRGRIELLAKKIAKSAFASGERPARVIAKSLMEVAKSKD